MTSKRQSVHVRIQQKHRILKICYLNQRNLFVTVRCEEGRTQTLRMISTLKQGCSVVTNMHETQHRYLHENVAGSIKWQMCDGPNRSNDEHVYGSDHGHPSTYSLVIVIIQANMVTS